MRRLLALGAFSLAGTLIGACGDDDPTPGVGGSGGRGGSAGAAGNAGNPGNGGTAGITGNGGTSGTGGTGGGSSGTGGTGGGSSGTGGTGGTGLDPDAGDGGGGPPCTGCVELRVPVTGGVDVGTEAQVTTFQFTLAEAGEDFSAETITFRVRALQLNDNMFVQAFAQDSNFSFNGVFRSLNAGGGFANTDDFIDLVYDLEAVPAVDVLFPDAGGLDGGSPDPGDFDKSKVRQFGLQVGAADDFPDTTTVTVLIDSITFDGVARTDVTFAADPAGFAINTFNNPVPGSEIIHHPE